MTAFTDAFTGTDGTTLTTYDSGYSYAIGGSANNRIEIRGNSARLENNASQTGGAVNIAVRTALIFASDHWVGGTIVNTGSAGKLHLAVRANGDAGVHTYISATDLRIYEADDATQIGSTATYTLAVNDVVKLQVVGTTATLFVNGVSKVSGTTSRASGGKPGIGWNGAASTDHIRIDDITMSDVFSTFTPTLMLLGCG